MIAELPIRRSPALPQGFAREGEDVSRRLYLQPTGILGGAAAAAAVEAGHGYALAGGPLVFTSCSVLLREDDHMLEVFAPVLSVLDWALAEGEPVAFHVMGLLEQLSSPRQFAGLDCDRPLIMGVVNVTPDSFSDGGLFLQTDAAISHGLALAEAGADIVDVGGESTRPGSAPTSPDEEAARVLPVIRALAENGLKVSVDTRHARVMGAALEAGAAIVNDVTALREPEAIEVCARAKAPVVVMHMQGDPGTMQDDPRYACAPLDVYDFLSERAAACREAGIEDICVDPGIGFGKTVAHNLSILSRLALLHGLGCPVLLGASRKSFIARLSGEENPAARLPGSLAAAQEGFARGAALARVHDAAETRQCAAVWRGIVTC